MQKTWKEIRNEVICLGFEKEKAYNKNQDTFITAFNWAMTHIATTVSPIYAEAIVEKIDGAFDFKKCPEYMFCVGVYTPEYTEYTPDVAAALPDGQYRVKYRKYPKYCGGGDDYVCELPYEYANIIAYLIAHRVWMDDDMSKSVLYWNTFEELKNQLSGRSGITVSGGWI